jgi:hypothetical protein
MCTAENVVVTVVSLGNVLDTQQIQNSSFIIFLCVVQHSNSVLGCLMNEVSGSPAFRHTHLLGFLGARDHVITEATTYTAHSKDERQTSMTSVRFEPTVSAVEWPQTAKPL